MSVWRVVQLSTAAVGVGSIILGRVLSRPQFDYIGIAILGFAGVLIGLEGIYKQEMILTSRYSRRGTETFLGAPGIAQGIQFVLVGIFLVGASLSALFNSGEYVFQYLVRRPGWLLLTFGLFCLSSAVIAFSGSVEQRTGTRFERILDLLAGRLLPGFILLFLALIIFGLGFLEILAPPVFDQLGGGFLEVLFIK